MAIGRSDARQGDKSREASKGQVGVPGDRATCRQRTVASGSAGPALAPASHRPPHALGSLKSLGLNFLIHHRGGWVGDLSAPEVVDSKAECLSWSGRCAGQGWGGNSSEREGGLGGGAWGREGGGPDTEGRVGREASSSVWLLRTEGPGRGKRATQFLARFLLYLKSESTGQRIWWPSEVCVVPAGSLSSREPLRFG